MHLSLKTLAVLATAIPATLTSNVYFQNGQTEFGDSEGFTTYGGATYEFGACGCNTVPSADPTICAYVNYEGQPVKFYASYDCSGSPVWEYTGSGAAQYWTCGSYTYETKVHIC